MDMVPQLINTELTNGKYVFANAFKSVVLKYDSK